MPSIDEVYSGKSLKAADLEGNEVPLTIANAEAKEFDDASKIVITFTETEKVFICNKTNANRIASSHGKDYSLWHGKKITLYPDMVDFKGDMVEAIRVKVVVNTGTSKPKFVQSENPAEGLDDEVPF